MLNFLVVLLILVSNNAIACWKIEGTLGVDGETWKIHQKFEHHKEYIMPAGNFILKLTLRPQSKNLNKLSYVLQEKKDNKLILVTQGEEEDIHEDKKREIFAKGETGQPNSIITIKLTNI
jgi:hypothetical protein